MYFKNRHFIRNRNIIVIFKPILEVFEVFFSVGATTTDFQSYMIFLFVFAEVYFQGKHNLLVTSLSNLRRAED